LGIGGRGRPRSIRAAVSKIASETDLVRIRGLRAPRPSARYKIRRGIKKKLKLTCHGFGLHEGKQIGWGSGTGSEEEDMGEFVAIDDLTSTMTI
jgi:hypothetical protein